MFLWNCFILLWCLYHFSLWSSCIFLFCAWFSFECRFIAARWALRLSKKILHLLTQHLCPVCHYTLVNYNYNWKTSIISVSMKKRDGKENPHVHCELISHMDLFFLWLKQISFDLHHITAEQLANLQLPVTQKISKSLRETCQMSSMHVTLWTGLFLAHCLALEVLHKLHCSSFMLPNYRKALWCCCFVLQSRHQFQVNINYYKLQCAIDC